MIRDDLIGKQFKDARTGSDIWTVSRQRNGICELTSDRRPVYRFHAVSKVLDRRYYRDAAEDLGVAVN